MTASSGGASSSSAFEQAALFADAVDRAAVAMAIVSAGGSIRIANPVFARMVGSSPAALAGARLSDVLSAATSTGAPDIVGSGAGSFRFAFRPAGEMLVEMTPSPLGDGCMVVRLHDSEHAAVRPSAEPGARSLAARDIVHLIQQAVRAPLTSIRGYAELMSGLIRDPEEMAELARVIHDEAVRLSSKVEDLAMLERITGHAVDLQIAHTDVNSVIRDAARRVEDAAHDVELQLALDAGAPSIEADRDALLHMMTGLIRNALLATPAGSQVLIETGRVRRRLVISVTDAGSAIASAELERVFDVFQWLGSRAGPTRHETSLALPIAREISRLHGWRVSAECRENNGLTIRVAVPITGVTPVMAAD